MNPEQTPDPSKENHTSLSTVEGSLDTIKKQIEYLIEKTEAAKRKDSWDKFGVISSFISSVLIAGVGLFYTMTYDRREKELQAQSAQQAIDLQALVTLSPQLSSSDPEVRKNAENILKARMKSESTARAKKEINDTALSAGVLENYFSTVNNKDAPKPQRIAAAKNLAAESINNSATIADQQKAENYVKTLQSAETIPTDIKTEVNSTLLQGLQPEVADLAKKLIAAAKQEGIDIAITSGYRSPKQQNFMFAQKITRLDAAHSAHCKGLAFDIVHLENGKQDWGDSVYEKLGKIGIRLGLTWGGKTDDTHFELRHKSVAQ